MDIVEEGMIYKITPTDGSNHMYIGATEGTLEGSLENHVFKCSNRKSRKKYDRKIYRMMAEKGTSNWRIELLEVVWMCPREEFLQLKRSTIRLLKPDLNSRNGSSSDEERDAARKTSSQPWTCPTCGETCRKGNKWNHRRTAHHRAAENRELFLRQKKIVIKRSNEFQGSRTSRIHHQRDHHMGGQEG